MDHFLFVIAYLFAVKKIAVLSKEIRDGKFQHPVSALKIQPVHTPERDKEDRPLVPPLLTQRRVFADLQALKQGLAVLLDVKKVAKDRGSSLSYPHSTSPRVESLQSQTFRSVRLPSA